MTPTFRFLDGCFKFAGSNVPYFQLSMTAREAIDHLSVARDLIFDPEEIVIEELFQRDIDIGRVQKEITPYLLRDGEIKFFNAMVVVLLPHSNNRLRTDYRKLDSTSKHGSLKGVEIERSKNSGVIRWDASELCPIIVDGQHRFSALKEVAESKPEIDLTETSVPVVLLILDSELGFTGHNESLLGAVRKIFIDLNRQAKTVSETRNILLDDRDVSAVAVRSLLEKRVKPGVDSIESRLEKGRMPLSLVDWYSDGIKFDRGLHITSILCLYKIIKEFLKIPKIDSFDYQNSGKLVARFLQLDESLDFSEAIAAADRKKLPVFLGHHEVHQFKEWFEKSWGPAIVEVLTSIKPYREFTQHLVTSEFLDGKYEPWLAMDRVGKDVFKKTVEFPEKIDLLQADVSKRKEDDLAFQVVFQKGLMMAFTEMASEFLAVPNMKRSLQSYAQEWASMYNERIYDRTKNHEFWVASMVRADGSINATKGAEKAVAAVIIFVLLAPFEKWRTLPKNELLDVATAYMHEMSGHTSVRGLSGMELVKYRHRRAWKDLVQKHLRDNEGVYGTGESTKGSQFMAIRVLDCFGFDPKVEFRKKRDPLEGLLDAEVDRDFDQSIDDLMKWTD
ncbi:DNA sulfur modification protein DndB [Mariniblastus sp.]|nr:DNA sulfur modification protein DndB [Mariniblastus sp.]